MNIKMDVLWFDFQLEPLCRLNLKALLLENWRFDGKEDRLIDDRWPHSLVAPLQYLRSSLQKELIDGCNTMCKKELTELKGCLFVGFLDVFLTGSCGHPQDLVVVDPL